MGQRLEASIIYALSKRHSRKKHPPPAKHDLLDEEALTHKVIKCWQKRDTLSYRINSPQPKREPIENHKEFLTPKSAVISSPLSASTLARRNSIGQRQISSSRPDAPVAPSDAPSASLNEMTEAESLQGRPRTGSCRIEQNLCIGRFNRDRNG